MSVTSRRACLNMGFRERALADFEALASTPDDPYLRAPCFMGTGGLACQIRPNPAMPRTACVFLTAAASMELPEVTAQRIAILKAEVWLLPAPPMRRAPCWRA